MTVPLHSPTTRYKSRRQLVDWRRTVPLRIVKQLAGTIKRFEACGQFDLWRRVEELLPDVTERVIGVRISFKALRDEVRTQQPKTQ